LLSQREILEDEGVSRSGEGATSPNDELEEQTHRRKMRVALENGKRGAERRLNSAASTLAMSSIHMWSPAILVQIGGVDDVTVLQAALLHDTVEDTKTSPGELEREFGAAVRTLVAEVSAQGILFGIRRCCR
jgi:(p)ppGpp synthase/HD superfamily hydrolase